MVKRTAKLSQAPQTPPRSGVDWAGMKPHWQAGILSIAELSRRYNVSRPAITKHWEKEKVERNLTEQIRAEAQSLVHKAEAAGTPIAAAAPVAQGVEPTDRETVAFNARMQAGVILRHRRDILGAQELVSGLLLELSWGGAEPLTLADGSTRTFLEDGDVVTLTASAPGPDGTRISFGEVTGQVCPAR